MLLPWQSPTAPLSLEDRHVETALHCEKQVPDALLWQYYLAHASGNMAATDSNSTYSEIWQSSIPAVAHTDVGTAHALMALSALCMSSHDAHGGSFDGAATAQMHYYKSLQCLRSSIPSLRPENADALLACAMLLIPCGLALASTAAGAVSEWHLHLRGFRSLADASSELRSETSARHELIPAPRGLPHRQLRVSDSGQSVPNEKVIELFYTIQRTKDSAIDLLKTTITDFEPTIGCTNAEVYLTAIDELEHMMDHVFECGITNNLRAIFSWTTEISPEFTRLLAGRDELALAIAAHWLVCTLLLHDMWYLRGFGAARINTVMEVVGGAYGVLLEWPGEMMRVVDE